MIVSWISELSDSNFEEGKSRWEETMHIEHRAYSRKE